MTKQNTKKASTPVIGQAERVRRRAQAAEAAAPVIVKAELSEATQVAKASRGRKALEAVVTAKVEAGEAEPIVEQAAGKAPAKKAEAKAAAPKAEPVTNRGPRGEHLDRHGIALEGELAGYVVKLAFAEFEVAQHPDRAGFVTVCRKHGHASATQAKKADAEKAGARKARAEWCPQCATEARQAARAK